ncbi:glycosyltransferase family 4 protein [Psychroflexus sediminis]|uniref:Glycosyltransferase involved in cell wall bisynthesis n=1 Tax=Psychroflexus sediminis TaxID=470826 RepID=A0A1G7Z3T7_9FLAO|nr:glycosyltransferase [Psychroflexus sediminis]SDH03432.1 Glycosyltransferase involved in cell wall bisynthesis [Psychroflexus sediminis]
MSFLILSSAPLIKKGNSYAAYTPYVDELVLWKNSTDIEFSFCCPVWFDDRGLLNKQLDFEIKRIYELSDFNLGGFKNFIKTLISSFFNLITIFKAMSRASHIHLRCPGNMGLLGCLVQILFPKTPKTAKYAGNWDPKSRQPWSYNLQKWILSNTWLTKNMQVLVYGEWSNQTKNIKPFFTATYREEEKESIKIRDYTRTLHFCFVGSLSKGKQPNKAIELVEKLKKEGWDVVLHIYGEGSQREDIESQIKKNSLEDLVFLYGNQPKAKVKEALQHSHFLILPSKSEGWPKVVAEAMFWGCIPVVTPVSCVPWMLDFGKRGVLMNDKDINETVELLQKLLKTPQQLETMANQAAVWSRQYTLDKFEEELKKLL